MKRWYRPVTVAVATVLVAGLVGTESGAAVIGSLTFDPATGTDQSTITVTTSGGCPEGATHVVVKVFGPGFPGGGQNVTPVTNSGVSTSSAFSVFFSDTMKNFAAQQEPPATLSGQYQVVVVCRTSLNATSLGDFTGSLWFTSPTAYQTTNPDPTDTTVTLGVAPTGPAAQGTEVTLTATVAPSGAAGTVQFKDGSGNLGSPVTVSAGTASLATSALAAGTHSLTAVFTPADAGAYDPSTSGAVSYVVNPPAPTVTVPPVLSVQLGTFLGCSASFAGATSVSYAWLRNGTPIAGATGARYFLDSPDLGKQVSCRTTGTNATGSASSTTTPVVGAAGQSLRSLTPPRMPGVYRVGNVLTCLGGSWSPAPASRVFNWMRNGRLVGSGTTYRLVPADRGTLVRCVEYPMRPGYATGVGGSGAARIA